MLVLSPAGLPPSSRSRPMAPPNRVASPIWSISCSRKISTIWLNTLQESHLVAYLRDCALGKSARAIRAIAQSIQDARRVALQRRRAVTHRRQRLDHIVRQHALAIETAPPRRPALLRDLGNGVGRRESLMQRVNVADLGRPGILPALACGIGGRRPELLPDRLRRLEQPDRVPQALGHLRF